ncbi:MAG TPA: TonB family protein [Steroidobacteraceae bacterium]|nr:TonB family protein [Steroidobacteraceae bacterium]
MSSLAEPLEPPARPQRRSADRGEGRASRDRLTTVLVLALLLHGLIIFGVTFTAPGGNGGVNRGLEVLLVPDELPEASRNDTATYFAQRTQLGSGNTQQRLPAQLPAERVPPPVPAGSQDSRPDGERTEPVLVTTADSPTRVQMLPLPPGLVHLAPGEQVEPQDREAQAGEDTLLLRGTERDQYYLSPDTRASPFAPYLDGWRRRVERIGTINYPGAARQQKLSGSPVIEVVINRDGRLQSARIGRASGHPELDAAALDILRLASPFDPFPPELARQYRSLRFAYEWQFEGGQSRGYLISVP